MLQPSKTLNKKGKYVGILQSDNKLNIKFCDMFSRNRPTTSDCNFNRYSCYNLIIFSLKFFVQVFLHFQVDFFYQDKQTYKVRWRRRHTRPDWEGLPSTPPLSSLCSPPHKCRSRHYTRSVGMYIDPSGHRSRLGWEKRVHE